MGMDRVDAAALVRAGALTPTVEPGERPQHGDALAGLWLSALERLVARAAHEVNGALNGLTVNLEVVRLKARPGADAGGVARFAEAAAADGEATVAMVGALLALARAPRDAAAEPSTDVAETLRQAAALVAPVVRHEGVTVELAAAGQGSARTRADRHAVRLALVEGLLAAAAAAAANGAPAARAADASGDRTVELAGADRADASSRDTDEPARVVRCTLGAPGNPGDADGAHLVRLAPAPAPPDGEGPPVRLPADVAAALAAAGVEVVAGGALVLRFPAV